MTAQEAHIELDLGLQRINSFDTSQLLPQEKDWFINNEVLKFIKQRTNPKSNNKGEGFEDTVKRLEDLKDLIVYKTLPVFNLDDKKGYINLPSDFLNYIPASEGVLQDTCNDFTISTGANKKFIFSIDNNLANANLPYTVKIEIELNNSTVLTAFDSTTLPNEYIDGGTIRNSNFLMVNAIMILMNDFLKENISDSELYRQNYSDKFINNSFILVSNSIQRIRVYTNNVYKDYFSNTDSYSYYAKNNNLENKIGKIEVVEHQYVLDFNNSVLSKSTTQKINSRLHRSVLQVYYPNGYVIPEINLVYVCKPSKIDLILNRNLNFEDDICKEIIDNTVRYLKGILSDGNYQAYIQENSLIE